MELIDLGRNRTIGANSLYIKLGGITILVDAGIDPKALGYACLPDFSAIPDNSLDYIILTHCHLDHVGALPVVLRRQPQAKILLTYPSSVLAQRMLRNSYNVMTKVRMELNILEYPLYTTAEIDDVQDHYEVLPLGKSRTFESNGEKLEITFHNAGHVAGACGVEMLYKKRRIFMTGDVLFRDQLTIPGAKFPEGQFDTLIMETTRGATERRSETSDRSTETKRLIDTINNTIKGGGSCLIPVFALGRMQELFALFLKERKNKQLVECPIFSSGLGLDLVDYFDEISRHDNSLHFRRKAFHELKVQPLPKKIRTGRDLPKKGIYLVSSGMMVPHTPAYFIAASLLEYKHNRVCFVGYCDPDTPGGHIRQLQKGDSYYFEALDYTATINADIEQFDLSGHADRDELLEFAYGADPRSIILTHGEEPARAWFSEQFAEMRPKMQVLDPIPGQTYQL